MDVNNPANIQHELEVTCSSEMPNQLTKVVASVRHELEPATTANPKRLREYEFNYHYGYGLLVNGVPQTLNQRLLVSHDGPPVGNPAQPCYTTHYTYESGRDGLLSMENTLNVGHMNPNGTRNAAGWVASSHGYDLDAQGRRVMHRERLKRAGNWNGWLGLDRAVDRTFGYDLRDQLTASTSTFPEGTHGLLPENTASGRLTEAESYEYDALGNRLTSTTPKSILAADWWVATPPSGAGNADTYVPNAANTYNSVTRNAGTPAVYKYDADGNLLDDGLCVYTWDAENRLLSVDPKTLSQYGECRYRFGYDYLSRRVRRSVYCFAGIWIPMQTNAFVYHGWNLALNEHRDVVATTLQLGSARMDRYVWGRDVSGTIIQGKSIKGELKTDVTQPEIKVKVRTPRIGDIIGIGITGVNFPTAAHVGIYLGSGIFLNATPYVGPGLPGQGTPPCAGIPATGGGVGIKFIPELGDHNRDRIAYRSPDSK